MNNSNKNIGLIECGTQGEIYSKYPGENRNGYAIKKIFVSDKAFAQSVKAQFPQVEIVEDTDAILRDSTIDLVIVSSPKAKDGHMVEEVLRSGKHVQVV